MSKTDNDHTYEKIPAGSGNENAPEPHRTDHPPEDIGQPVPAASPEPGSEKSAESVSTPAEANPAEPRTLPVLAVRNTVLFPDILMPLAAARPSTLAAVEAALGSEEKNILVVPQKDAAIEKPTRDDLFDLGTVAVIKKADRNEDTVSLIVQGLERVRLGREVQHEPFMVVEVESAPVHLESSTEADALKGEMIELATRIAELLEGNAPAAVVQILSQVKDPLALAYLLASMLGLSFEKDLELLAADSNRQVFQLMHQFLSHELKVHQLRAEIAANTESEMSREQREYYLRRQLESIREELGENSPEDADIAEMRDRLEKADLPDNVREEAERELERLERLSPNASDYQLTRTHLELILELPWKTTTRDNLDLDHARKVLDEDHYELNDVKDRIIEHLAVMQLNPESRSPILCLVGPPGVGKTSLGKSIARALGRKFERLALGGLHDESELRGHRRTYIGAMPGRIIEALRRARSRNPLIMLDEIDKLGRDFRGDPAAALMEILDPEQNVEFHDNYLDLPFDLSQVFFLTTANSLDTIPRPLLDRMEVLRLAGYSSDEKEQIARRYLIARQLADAGLDASQVNITDEALRYVIQRYTREAGVRELERMLGRVARKIATQVVRGQEGPFEIDREQVIEILGPERFSPEKVRQNPQPGVAAGLAWTPTGGDVLYIEAADLGEGGKLTLTGQLGDIMRESAQAARSHLITVADKLALDREKLVKSTIHIHVPAGAVPKDGPSAGVTMATALASLVAGLPVRSDTAMTGEITLSGLVLPVGGIKEKVLAAHRAGIRRVILPRDNEKDLTELPKHVREEMEFVLANRIEEVLQSAIKGLQLSGQDHAASA